MFPTPMYLRCSLLCLQKRTNFHVSGYFNSIHIFVFHLFRSSLIPPFHLFSYFSTGLFPTCLKKITCTSKFPQTCCMSYPYDSPLVYLCNETRWRSQIVIPSRQPFHHTQPSCHHSIFQQPPSFFKLGNETKCHTHTKHEAKPQFSICISIFMILDRIQEDKNSQVRCN